MFYGEGLVYVRHEHRAGISQTTGAEYEFANVTLSDGLESFKLPIDFAIVKDFESFNRGESIDLVLDIDVGYNNRVNVLITKAEKSKAKV